MGQRDDDLMRHLGTLWRTAMVGLDTLREVAVRSSEAGRLRVDVALLQRERSQLLETMGEMIVGMIDDQTFEDVPESVKQTYSRIKDVDQRIRRDDARLHPDAPRDDADLAAVDLEDEPAEPDTAPGAAPASPRTARSTTTPPHTVNPR